MPPWSLLQSSSYGAAAARHTVNVKLGLEQWRCNATTSANFINVNSRCRCAAALTSNKRDNSQANLSVPNSAASLSLHVACLQNARSSVP
jgi:hypothetical protein